MTNSNVGREPGLLIGQVIKLDWLVRLVRYWGGRNGLGLRIGGGGLKKAGRQWRPGGKGFFNLNPLAATIPGGNFQLAG